jgi:hypothetical protein
MPEEASQAITQNRPVELHDMAIKRIRIDYTVYPPNHDSGEPCCDFRTFLRAKGAARAFGSGSRIYRNFNQTNKRGQDLRDWWSRKSFWTWDGALFRRRIDKQLIPRP